MDSQEQDSKSVFTEEWRRENERRVKDLNKRYKEDGRDKEDHPLHGLFTGLNK